MPKEHWNEETAEYYTSQAYEDVEREMARERRIRALARRVAALERIDSATPVPQAVAAE